MYVCVCAFGREGGREREREFIVICMSGGERERECEDVCVFVCAS